MNKYELKSFIIEKIRICQSNATCLPTTQELAREAGCSQPSVSRMMQEMAQEGLIQKIGKRYYPVSVSNHPRDRGTVVMVTDHVSSWTDMHVDMIKGASRALGPFHRLLLIQREAEYSRLLHPKNDHLNHVEEIYDLPEGGDILGVLFLQRKTNFEIERRLVERRHIVALNERLATESINYVAPDAVEAASVLVDHLEKSPVNELVLIKHKRAWLVETDFLEAVEKLAEERGYSILKKLEDDINDPTVVGQVMATASGGAKGTGIICPDPVAAQKIQKRLMLLEPGDEGPLLFSAFGATSIQPSPFPYVAFDYEEMGYLASKAVIEGKTIQHKAKPRMIERGV